MSYRDFVFHCTNLVDAFLWDIITEEQFNDAMEILCTMNPHHALEAANDWSLDMVFAQLPQQGV